MSNGSDQLAYVLINPYTIYKSRTGGVISRLFTRTALDLVAARMFAPSRELVEEYASVIVTAKDTENRRIQMLIRQYILDNYAPHPQTGQRRRVMMLLFRGEDAGKKVRAAVGPIEPGRTVAGETIRDTYGDFILGPDNEVRYFEPAVLAARTAEDVEQRLKIWAKYSDTDGGLLEGVVRYPDKSKVQQTLVLLKPDNFRFASARPGSIVDLISRTGLFIIAIKVHHMSVTEAREFYGPVRELLPSVYLGLTGPRAKTALEKEFGFELPRGSEKKLGEMLAPCAAEHQFNRIVNFMTGHAAGQDVSGDPGKIVALVYEGPDAVAKIRNVLGATDPNKAAVGTIRRELGQDVMVNAAHASDSPENAKREMNIINIRENNLKPLIEKSYKHT
ncbi:MAG: nucleoside-diphosphate kinase [Verrucomicrobia bacterium]|nr:nucleoside-diphosphate kinase [Verrucomicrobiota bacterium]